MLSKLQAPHAEADGRAAHFRNINSKLTNLPVFYQDTPFPSLRDHGGAWKEPSRSLR